MAACQTCGGTVSGPDGTCVNCGAIVSKSSIKVEGTRAMDVFRVTAVVIVLVFGLAMAWRLILG